MIEPDYTINYTDLNYTINYINNYDGSIKFNNPVNMTWLEENWNDVFKVFWTDTDYRVNLVEQKFQ